MNHTAPQSGSGFYFAFGAEPSPQTADRLADQVMERITTDRLRRARTAAWLYALSTALGAVLLIPAISYTYSFAVDSGFSDYLSLLATNGADLAGSWKAITLSLVESAPLVGSVLVLAALLVCGFCITRLVSDINRLKHYRHAII